MIRKATAKIDEVNDMDLHKKKMIPPIVVTILMILYYVVYFTFLACDAFLRSSKVMPPNRILRCDGRMFCL